jgi:hypothetical protein
MIRRRYVYLVGALAVVVALSVVVWKPWQQRTGPATGDPDPPADTASMTISKRFGGPCRVEILGAGGDASNLASASLAAGEARSTPLLFPAPYTIEAVTVTRDGPPQRREVKITLAGGRRYDLVITADDTVAVAPTTR